MTATRHGINIITVHTAKRDITRDSVNLTTVQMDGGIAIDAGGIITGRGAGTLQELVLETGSG